MSAAIVQTLTATGTLSGAGRTATISGLSATSASNLLIAEVSLSSATGVTITQSSPAWTQDAQKVNASAGKTCALLSKVGDGSTSYTFDFGATNSGQSWTIRLTEWSGLTIAAADKTAVTSGTFGTAVNTGTTATTTQADEVLIALFVAGGSGSPTISGVTAGFSANGSPFLVGTTLKHFSYSKTVAATGTYTCAGTLSNGNSYVAAIATYKIAAPPAPPIPTCTVQFNQSVNRASRF